jgi:hypothetical protein
MEDKVVGFIAPKDYTPPTMEQVVEVTPMDLAGARNVFARVSKALVRANTSDSTKRQIDEHIMAHPSWVVSHSIAVCMERGKEECGRLVEECVVSLATTINEMVENKGVMLGALTTKIHDLGNGWFNYVLKQKFTRQLDG